MLKIQDQQFQNQPKFEVHFLYGFCDHPHSSMFFANVELPVCKRNSLVYLMIFKQSANSYVW